MTFIILGPVKPRHLQMENLLWHRYLDAALGWTESDAWSDQPGFSGAGFALARTALRTYLAFCRRNNLPPRTRFYSDLALW